MLGLVVTHYVFEHFPHLPEGQLSEVVRLDPAEADVPIQPDQAVAGSPDGESGRPQEGRAGPNARTGSDTDPA